MSAQPRASKPLDVNVAPPTATKVTPYVIIVAAIAAVGGLLFGYDTGVISGAILFIKNQFKMPSGQEEFVTSAVLIGAVLGALLGGYLASRIGRKWSIIVGAGLFLVGTAAAAFAPDVSLLIFARVVTGMGIGLASFVVPMYISEMSPAHIRGTMTSLNQLALVLGILLAYVVDYVFTKGANWRMMFAIGLIPAAVLGVGMLFMPRSPRWLISKGRAPEAKKVLEKTRGTPDVQPEIDHTQAELKAESGGGYRGLLVPLLRLPLIIGIGLAILQQVTGINTVIYYAPTIFQMAGFGSAGTSIAATAGVGVVNLIGTIVAIFLVDRRGRRPLLLWSLAGMTAALILLAAAFGFRSLLGDSNMLGILTAAGLMIYVFAFAIGLGPVFWLLISEIYPLNVRGPAMSMATVANWGANWLVSATFLSLVNMVGQMGTFLLYAAIGAFAWFFVRRLVPETKGKTLEQVQAVFAAREHLASPTGQSKARA